MNLLETMDEENYPTDETERMVREFSGSARDLMTAIKTVWAYADWGWKEEDALDVMDKRVHRYNVSTAGWSGNESIVEALHKNTMFWMRFWVQERRGGHFIFEIPEEDKDATVLQIKRKAE